MREIAQFAFNRVIRDRRRPVTNDETAWFNDVLPADRVKQFFMRLLPTYINGACAGGGGWKTFARKNPVLVGSFFRQVNRDYFASFQKFVQLISPTPNAKDGAMMLNPTVNASIMRMFNEDHRELFGRDDVQVALTEFLGNQDGVDVAAFARRGGVVIDFLWSNAQTGFGEQVQHPSLFYNLVVPGWNDALSKTYHITRDAERPVIANQTVLEPAFSGKKKQGIVPRLFLILLFRSYGRIQLAPSI